MNGVLRCVFFCVFFFQAEDGIRDLVRSRGLGDVYKRQGQLGDGRAINLFETKVHDQRWALQLKGAGLTPYSRTADGLAVLRSSVREYLCSEAMYFLGVPTTRALSLMLTGDEVLRDMMYDGNAAYEKGAVVCLSLIHISEPTRPY